MHYVPQESGTVMLQWRSENHMSSTQTNESKFLTNVELIFFAGFDHLPFSNRIVTRELRPEVSILRLVLHFEFNIVVNQMVHVLAVIRLENQLPLLHDITHLTIMANLHT